MADNATRFTAGRQNAGQQPRKEAKMLATPSEDLIPILAPQSSLNHRCELCNFTTEISEESPEVCRSCKKQIRAWQVFRRLVNELPS